MARRGRLLHAQPQVMLPDSRASISLGGFRAIGIFFMTLPNTLVQLNTLRALPLNTAFVASRNTHFT